MTKKDLAERLKRSLSTLEYLLEDASNLAAKISDDFYDYVERKDYENENEEEVYENISNLRKEINQAYNELPLQRLIK